MDRLSAHLRYVGRNVPFFREHGCDDGRPLAGFPCTLKAEIRANYAAFLSAELAARHPDLVERLSAPVGTDRGSDGSDGLERQLPVYGRYHGDVLIEQTSGTSGTPFRIARRPEERLRIGAGMWRCRRGVDPDVRPTRLFPMIHWGPDEAAAGDPWRLDLANLQSLYGTIAAGRYRWIHCDPRILMQHIEAFAAAGWRPALPDLAWIETANQFVDARTADRLCTFFGARHVDLYGMLETLGVAITCVHGVHYVIDENVHVEILDEHDRPVPLGTVGRVVVTSLHQKLFPFVRYVTDDFAAFTDATCACRPGGQALALAAGRASNLVKGLNGMVFGNRLFEHILRNLMGFELTCVHIRQVTPDDFIVETNPLDASAAFMDALTHMTARKMKRRVAFRHVVLSDTEMTRRRRQKPWLFRCEC